MTVGELRKLLESYRDDIDIVIPMYSDYVILEPVDCKMIVGVEKNGWVMRSHPTMSAENVRNEKSYLALDN